MIPDRTRCRLGSLVTALLLGFLVSACVREGDPQTSLAQARLYLDQRKPDSAIIALKNALQANPDLAEARFLLGKTYFEDGRANAAEIELRKALSLQFNEDQTLILLVNSLLAQGKADEVLREFNLKKIRSVDAQAELSSLIGMAYFSSGNFDMAQKQFAEAEKIKPDYPLAVLGNARVLAERKDFGGAEAIANRLLLADPKNLSALLFKGDLHRAQNQLDKAITDYEVVVAQDSKNVIAHLNLANIYLVNDQSGAARAQIEMLEKIAPKHPGVLYLHALLFFNAQEYEKADEAIQRALLASPDYTQALLLAGTIELQLNRPALSEQHLRRALSRSPNNLFALKKLATLYVRQKEPLKAQDVLHTAIKIAPDDLELLTLGGDLAMTLGEFNQAATYLSQATQLSPKDAHALTRSALAQFAQGKNEPAIAQLESAARLDSDNARPNLLLILAHLQRKEYELALQSWASIQKKQPDNPSTYNLQGAILLAKQDVTAARKAFEHALKLQPTNFQAIVNLAKLDMDEHKTDAAKQRFRPILEKDKSNLSALLMLAGIEQATGAPRQSILKLLNEARQGNAASIEPILALTKFHMDAHEDMQALAAVNEGLTKLPKNQRLLDTLGMLQIRTGEINQAVETYTKLVADYPNDAEFMLHLGRAQLAAGKPDEATTAILNAVQLNPDAAAVQVAAVNAFLDTEKADEARKMIEQIRTLAPKSPQLQRLEGDVWMAKQNYVAASVAYQKALAVVPTNDLLMKTHQALNLAGKKPEAEALLTDWLRSHPDDIALQTYLADLSANAGDFAKAKVQYGTLLNQQPNNPALLNNMAWASLQLKDAKALGYAEKAYSLAPSNPDIADTFGWILVEQDQRKRGIEILEQASNQFPKQAVIKMHLAKALIRDGQKENARDVLNAIIKDNGDAPLTRESAQLIKNL